MGILNIMGQDISEPSYANGVEILGNPVEIRLRFYFKSPDSTKMQAEIVMPPMIAKGFFDLFKDKMGDWEKEYGNIYMPDDLKGLEGLFGVKLHGESRNEPEENGDDKDDV